MHIVCCGFFFDFGPFFFYSLLGLVSLFALSLWFLCGRCGYRMWMDICYVLFPSSFPLPFFLVLFVSFGATCMDTDMESLLIDSPRPALAYTLPPTYLPLTLTNDNLLTLSPPSTQPSPDLTFHSVLPSFPRPSHTHTF